MAARVKRMAPCHPDRPVLAQDLCSTCYRRKRRDEPDYREHEREWHREYQRGKAKKRTPRERFERGLNNYGLTFEDYTALVIKQSGRCAACGDPSPDIQIDHCHTKGHVRGLLCPNCNSALGHARDDIDRLRALITYLLAVAVDTG